MAVVKCVICGVETSKSKSYAVGNGSRACRIHEGVAEKSAKLQQEEKDKRAAEEQAKEDARRRKAQAASELSEPFTPRCWFCRKSGIHEREVYLKMLVLSEKQEIKGKTVSPFDPEYAVLVKKSIGLKDDQVVISVLPLVGNEHMIPKLRPDLRALPHLAGALGICQNCIKIHGGKREERPMIDPFVALSVYDSVRPIFKEMAQSEIDREAADN